MTRLASSVFLAVLALPAWGTYDANGVALGASEKEVLEQFPSAYCTALQWKSRAADRRCDDGKIRFGGAPARITFYLRNKKVEAYDVRFSTGEAEGVAAFLKSRWGPPAKEMRETPEVRGRARHVHKLQWKSGEVRAVLTSIAEKRRASLTVSRGDFENEIYRLR